MSVTRRSFLKITLGINGALLISLPLDGLRAETGGSGTAHFPWLEIGKNNQLTLHLSQTEMGQGIDLALSAMVCEELNLSPESLTLKYPSLTAQTHPSYKAYGTGGSFSIRRNWPLMREGAAALANALQRAAAGHWQRDQGQLRLADGFVTDTTGQKKISFYELAGMLKQGSGGEISLKSPDEYRYIGSDFPDPVIHKKVTGQLDYASDIEVPGQCIAMIARPERLGAKPVSVNRQALASHKDIRDILVMPDGVAVVGSSYWAVSRAVAALEVQWDESDCHPWDSDYFDEAYQSARQQEPQLVLERGAKAGTSGKTVSASYQVPFLAHAPMESMNCSAVYRDGKLTVWAPTQVPEAARQMAVDVSGLPAQNVELFALPMGGAFGRRLHQDYVAEAVYIAMRVSCPVKLLWTREDDIRHCHFRPRVDVDLTAELDDKGQLLSMTHHVVGPGKLNEPVSRKFHADADSLENRARYWIDRLTNHYMPDKSVGTLAQGIGVKHYQTGHHRVYYHFIDTGVPKGLWRSVGYYPNTFAIESFVDELAALQNRDPLDFRLALISKDAREFRVLDAVRRFSGWDQKSRPMGVALFSGYDSVAAMVVTLKNSDGTVPVIDTVYCAADCGLVISPDRVRSQLEGGILFGLSSVLYEQIQFSNGVPRQSNFDDYPLLRFQDAPIIRLQLIDSEFEPGGVGELAVPLVAPAVGNALAAAGKTRPRRLPLLAQG